MNDAFLSIVAHRTKPGTLLVRARRKGEIEAVFPQAKVERTEQGYDYLFRAYIPKDEVAQAIAKRLTNIRYSDFKGSVRDTDRHVAYQNVWCRMREYQGELE